MQPVLGLPCIARLLLIFVAYVAHALPQQEQVRHSLKRSTPAARYA